MQTRHVLTVLLILAMVALASCQSTNVEHMTLHVPGRGNVTGFVTPQDTVTVIIGNRKIVATSAAENNDDGKSVWQWLTSLTAGAAAGSIVP